LLGGLILVVFLGLALQGVARTSLIMPMLYLAWLADLVFRSVPGWLWWAWFIVIALVITTRSLRTRPGGEPAPRQNHRPTDGAIRIWMARLQMNAQGDYFRWRLARELAELALQFLAYRDREDLTRRDRSQYIELLNAPSDIQAYLRTGLVAPPWQPQDIRARLTRWWRPAHHDSPLQLDPAVIAQFLEGQLEKEHDD
jgi:hypothetical protein